MVMLTHSEDHEVINAALRNGARGYVVYNEIEMEYLSRASFGGRWGVADVFACGDCGDVWIWRCPNRT